MNHINLLFNCTDIKPSGPYVKPGPCHLQVGVIASHDGVCAAVYAPLAEMPVELHTASFEEWCEHEWAKPLIEQAKIKLLDKFAKAIANLEGVA